MAKSLPLPLLLAWRFLRSARREATTSFLSAVAGGGIALGVAALVVALAALAGLQRALRAEIVARTPHLEIELAPGHPVAPWLAALDAEPGVRSAQETVRGRGWLVAGGAVREVELSGFSAGLPRSFPEARGTGVGLYLGDGLAARLGVREGDRLEIVTARPTLTPLGPAPRARTVTVAGTFHSGRTERLERVALPLSAARALLPTSPTRIEVATDGLDAALALASRLGRTAPAGDRVRTWQDLNRPLFFALQLERAVMFAAVSLVVLVAALALATVLSLVQAAKWREIGALAAMGARPGSLVAAFTLLGTALAAAGASAGAGLGALVAWTADRHRLVRLPGEVYFVDYLPFAVRPGEVALVVAVALALGVGFSLWGARRSARLRPVEALRR